MKRRKFIKTLALGGTLIGCQPFFAVNCRNKKDGLSVARFCQESERNIPLIDSVDIVVVGGSTAAVAAASKASRNGATVFLVAPRLYLGEDICSTLRLKIDKDRTLKTDLEKQLFGSEYQTTPTKVKDILIQTLEEAKIKYVFGSYVTDILWEQKEKPAGIVMANRSGRQAVKSKVIIDATDRAWVCRMTGVKSRLRKGSKLNFQRTVIESPQDNNYEGKPVEYNTDISMPDLHFSSFARAEQIARDTTYKKGQWRASERLFCIPPEPIVCQKKKEEWDDSENISIDHFKPEGIKYFYLLSGAADIPRSKAQSLLEPAALTETGEKIGKSAAREANNLSQINEVELRNNHPDPTVKGDTKEILTGLRAIDKNLSHVRSPSRSLPVFGEYDVVVAGGGTAGAASAIAATRRGERVLIMEYQEGLGGTGTVGLIGKPYHGEKIGFASEVPFPEKSIEPKMEWYRKEIRKAGGEIWFGVISCGAYMQENHAKGVVVATPEARGVVLGKVVIDATGNGDIAIAAGADYRYGTVEEDQIALQGSGYPMRPLTGSYVNTDYLLVDESDLVDVRRSIIGVTRTKGTKNEININYGKYAR
ncbi:MAG: FAD-dependent oxidoreductase, partial [Bacteroidales bacterium]|nr:FAD-dependent oxidoreductase [Bacteroidales bacterium]